MPCPFPPLFLRQSNYTWRRAQVMKLFSLKCTAFCGIRWIIIMLTRDHHWAHSNPVYTSQSVTPRSNISMQAYLTVHYSLLSLLSLPFQPPYQHAIGSTVSAISSVRACFQQMNEHYRSQWSHSGPRHEMFSPGQAQGLWVRIPPIPVCMSAYVCSVLSCVGNGLAPGIYPVEGAYRLAEISELLQNGHKPYSLIRPDI
jgi:hypothetical protein